MSRISWGKCRIFVKDTDDSTSKWKELLTPILDSTFLTPTKGDKQEAKIEGGENEDVKYKRSTYAVTFNIRKGKLPNGQTRPKPFPSLDGVVEHHFAILLQPEDPTCEGFHIADCTVTVDDNYDTANGAIWAITMDALKAEIGDTVKWGVVTLGTTGSGSSATNTIAFTEGSSFDADSGEGSSAFTLAASEVILVSSTAVAA